RTERMSWSETSKTCQVMVGGSFRGVMPPLGADPVTARGGLLPGAGAGWAPLGQETPRRIRAMAQGARAAARTGPGTATGAGTGTGPGAAAGTGPGSGTGTEPGPGGALTA